MLVYPERSEPRHDAAGAGAPNLFNLDIIPAELTAMLRGLCNVLDNRQLRTFREKLSVEGA
jgi:hypothetical protein